MLTKEELNLIQEILLSKKNNLEDLVKGLEKNPDFNDEANLEDEANESEEFESIIVRKEEIKNHLERVEKALGKIKKEKYGKCENCEKEMSFKLLKINPETDLCKNCKKNK